MSAFWIALAYATELSDRTLAATAALTGIARLALISDMAARSGSSSPASSVSSSRVRGLYCSVIAVSPLDRLRDVARLRRIGDRRRVVGQGVERDRGVDRRGDVGVDQRH